ncbi:short-chain dehydrogenase, partial [Salmonella enterica]|nr:short-chain dehydrogenase [Salmonella enterica]
LRYPVTLDTHAVALLKRLLPARAMDKIIHG